MPLHNKVTLNSPLAIGALSKKTKVNIETIRYYERVGVMPRPPRNSAGHRIYAHSHLKRLTFVKRSRELGFTLKEIRTLLGLVDGDDYSCEEIRIITLKHRADIQTKIKDLQRLENTLTQISDKCTGGNIPECPIIDALFETEDKFG